MRQTWFDSGLTPPFYPVTAVTAVISSPPAVSFSSPPRASSFPRSPLPDSPDPLLSRCPCVWSPCSSVLPGRGAPLVRGAPPRAAWKPHASCVAVPRARFSSVPHLSFVARFFSFSQVISPLFSLPPVRFRLSLCDLVRRGFRRLPGVLTVGTSGYCWDFRHRSSLFLRLSP